MTDRCLPLCLATLVISLLTPGCQETSAPAASGPGENSVAASADKNDSDKNDSDKNDSDKPDSDKKAPSPNSSTDAKDGVADTAETPAVVKTVANPAPPAKLRDFTFDDLKFDIEKGGDFKRDMLTDKIEGMVDTPIRIRGYILPSFQQTGLKQFVLVRDNMECCFGPGAALFDCILVEMNEGKSANFSVRPVAVEGKFTINEFIGPDGKHLAVFHLQGEAVK